MRGTAYSAERGQVLNGPRKGGRLRFVFLGEFRKPQPEIVRQPIDAPSPPIASSDYRRFDKSKRSQRRGALSCPARTGAPSLATRILPLGVAAAQRPHP